MKEMTLQINQDYENNTKFNCNNYSSINNTYSTKKPSNTYNQNIELFKCGVGYCWLCCAHVIILHFACFSFKIQILP